MHFVLSDETLPGHVVQVAPATLLNFPVGHVEHPFLLELLVVPFEQLVQEEEAGSLYFPNAHAVHEAPLPTLNFPPEQDLQELGGPS
jgi:hypothetical protein